MACQRRGGNKCVRTSTETPKNVPGPGRFDTPLSGAEAPCQTAAVFPTSWAVELTANYSDASMSGLQMESREVACSVSVETRETGDVAVCVQGRSRSGSVLFPGLDSSYSSRRSSRERLEANSVNPD